MSKRPSTAQNKKTLPEWNFYTKDQSEYKLTQAEQLQKKVSLISKNTFKAKEEWQQRQIKLQNNIKDQEITNIYKTALESKNLIKKPNLKCKKNLEKSLNKKNSIKDIQNTCKETRKFIEKVEKIQKSHDTNKLPSKILTIVKNMEEISEQLVLKTKESCNQEVEDLQNSLLRIEKTISYLERKPNTNDTQQETKNIKSLSDEKYNINYQDQKIYTSLHAEFENLISKQNKILKESLASQNLIDYTSQSPIKQVDLSNLQNMFVQEKFQNDNLYLEDLNDISNEGEVSFSLTQSDKSENVEQSQEYNYNIQQTQELNESVQPQFIFTNKVLQAQFQKQNQKKDCNERKQTIKMDFSENTNSILVSNNQQNEFINFQIKSNQKIEIKTQQEQQEDSDEDKLLKSIQEMMESTRNDLQNMQDYYFEKPDYSHIKSQSIYEFQDDIEPQPQPSFLNYQIYKID